MLFYKDGQWTIMGSAEFLKQWQEAWEKAAEQYVQQRETKPLGELNSIRIRGLTINKPHGKNSKKRKRNH